MKKLLLTIAGLFAVGMSFTQAQTTDFNKWQVRLRGVAVIPTPSADIATIGGDVDINTKFIPELDFTYFFTKNIAAELILGTTKHNVNTTGSDLTAIGLGASEDVDLGSVWLLPPTLTAQYHFYPGKLVKPYVGAGVNYTIFYNVDEGNTVKGVEYKNKFGFATQIGTDINITDKFFLNVDAKYIFLKTDVDVDASNLAAGLAIPATVDINPFLVGVGIGYKF
ncbi:OmpW family protein [Sphingobacterium sp. BN32]|uniref:OmpW/AlkL family protein n=1 Tax=Sphingobacterium sp. BN32 TaxID=3058432 RepID=UPI00265CC328|nr:OmpW family outer membrane protein [Sphingobacterium sp. BN32]WKK58091.1 OmpW family outer membrane protein [Sphingobacterium sp. BN32]